MQSPSRIHRRVATALVVLCVVCAGARGELIGHWQLDGNAQDATGANHGTVEGTNYDWVSSAPSPDALRINESGTKDAYVRVGDAPELDFGAGDFTVSYRVKKLEASDSWTNVWGVGKWNTGAGAGSNEWGLDLTAAASGDQAAFYIESGNTMYQVESPNAMTLDEWHHLVAARRGTDIQLYLDGQLVDEAHVGNAAVNNVGRELMFGASASPNAKNRPRAVFDDVQIYNEALSDGGVSVGETASGWIGWLHANPGIPTPEPSATILLILAATLVMSRRRFY